MGDCKDCKKYQNDCGNHHEDSNGHIDYEIAAIWHYDTFGSKPDCFQPSEKYIEQVKEQAIKELINTYHKDVIKEAYIRLFT